MADEAGRKSTAASARYATVLEGPDRNSLDSSVDCDGRKKSTPASLARLTALRYEDVEGRRIILHADLSRAKEEGHPSNIGEGVGGGGGQDVFSEAVQLVAEQVREMLSANPAVVAIVSEVAPPIVVPDATAPVDSTTTTTTPPGATQLPRQSSLGLLPPEMESSSSPEAHAGTEEVPMSSLRATAAMVSSLLGMEVDFYDSVPELATAMRQCDGDGHGGGNGGGWTSFGARVMMAERLGAPGVVPAPPVEEPELSDDEEDRLPDFGWGGEGMATYMQILRKLFVLFWEF